MIDNIFSYSFKYYTQILSKNVMLLCKEDNLKNIIESNPILVVDYYAKWCRPCKLLAPKLEKLINSKHNIKMIKIDVDEHKNLIYENKITVVPTIYLYQKGIKKIEIKGSDISELENIINKI